MLLDQVNSNVSCCASSIANNQPMEQKKQTLTISSDPVEDAKRLKVMLEKLKVTTPGYSQAKFAEENGIGTQAQLWQMLNPENDKGRPLNLQAAIGFAKGLNCKVKDFSPSLQAAIDEISNHAQKADEARSMKEPSCLYNVTPEKVALDAEEAKLLRGWRMADQRDRHHIMLTIDDILKTDHAAA